MKRKTGNIEKDFDCIILLAIADSAIQDAINNLTKECSKEMLWSIRSDLVKNLIMQANDCYKAQFESKSKIKGLFMKINNATEMRDTLYQFMRHWLASILQKNNISLYKELPTNYGWSR